MNDKSMHERIEKLADAGLLTEKQAEVFIRREIELEPRGAVADVMGISENVHDKHLRAARDKVEAAEETVEEIENQRYEEIPDVCAECGSALGNPFSENDEGEEICLDCAGVEVSES